ncbi:MAG: hypothetical protein AAFQ80_15610 [Cyanobacteria bacterium J06621_8]
MSVLFEIDFRSRNIRLGELSPRPPVGEVTASPSPFVTTVKPQIAALFMAHIPPHVATFEGVPRLKSHGINKQLANLKSLRLKAYGL